MSSNSQINQQSQLQNAGLVLPGPVDLVGLGGGMGVSGPALVGAFDQQGPAEPNGNGVQTLSVDAENFAVQHDGMSLTQDLYGEGDGQRIPFTPTSDDSLSPDTQGQGTASSISTLPFLPTAGAATQAARDTHIHGQQDGSSFSSSVAALAADMNVSTELAQQIIRAVMNRRRLLGQNQLLMDTIAKVCPECGLAMIVLTLEVFDGVQRTVRVRQKCQALQEEILVLQRTIIRLADKLRGLAQAEDSGGDDLELSEDETYA